MALYCAPQGPPNQNPHLPHQDGCKGLGGDRMDRELADHEARGGTPGEETTISELIEWRINELASIRAVSNPTPAT